MPLNKDLLSTGVGKPIASGQRRFSAYALQLVGAVVGASAIIFTVLVLPARIADASSHGYEYGQAVSLGWLAFWQFMVVVPASAVGALIASLGLLILRGYRRSLADYVLIGVAGVGLVVSGAACFVIQAERGLL
ncbi:hypothetical protein LQ757_11140 [Agromyces sp. SYSU K20354]|uniref:hypothetical protein n=1 Tax=Agromyces cavernae TaxID=2898659 RepID=UPI001E55BB43|nr:hypothetical protein [Agromyces cavernae]MCD2442828.1 hypothetical protein [Agromyces cavernae]